MQTFPTWDWDFDSDFSDLQLQDRMIESIIHDSQWPRLLSRPLDQNLRWKQAFHEKHVYIFHALMSISHVLFIWTRNMAE